jgi:hypothetical protein
MNLLDVSKGGAEMLGEPIYSRLWTGSGQLRRPFTHLIEWFLSSRPGAYDPLTVAYFVARIAGVLVVVEQAINTGEHEDAKDQKEA